MTAAAPGRVASPVWVGVDVGGSKVLAGVVDATGGPDGPPLGRTAERGTPGRRVPARLVEDAVVGAVLEAAGGAPLAGVGLAAAGFVDAAGEHVVFAPHLPWRGEPVRRLLADRLGAPVVLENDATAAAYGEATLGAARGADPALLVALGTGIGGGFVVGGRVVRGHGGMAGEFGHARLVPDGHPCECGGRGCWEQYASGRALERFARDALGTAPSVLLERCGGDPAAVTGPMVSAAAAEGDLVARQAFASVGEWLGIGLANLVAAFDPEVVVVGGGVARAGDRLLDPARLALRRTLVGGDTREPPPVVPAALGAAAGLVGAGLLARAAYGG